MTAGRCGSDESRTAGWSHGGGSSVRLREGAAVVDRRRWPAGLSDGGRISYRSTVPATNSVSSVITGTAPN